ncbi:hypothetical protein FQN51_003747 [Onygenales sp. PD_10]|nr:hypothetical protein FQN51_003747 [Onygenales sp. PD_10]
MVGFTWKWLWGCRDSTTKQLEAAQISGANRTPPELADTAAKPARSPCKSCRERGVECDSHYPQCSQCFQEQLLCFYTAGPRRKGRTVKRACVATQPMVTDT